MADHESAWEPLGAQAVSVAEAVGRREPCVLRQRAAHWPAVAQWTWERLGALAPDLPVRLVQGNRELGATVFQPSTLGAYLQSLQGPATAGEAPLYLKEFNLLGAFPTLRADVRPQELFPPGALHDAQTWIGPAEARTGLHHDYLDNLAVQLVGRKRFYLLRPGAVERLGAVAAKHDHWAALASLNADAVVDRGVVAGDAWVVDLEPGDVLYVPARWWHEVVNHTPSLLLSGFFGTRTTVYAQWAWRQAVQGAHLAGLWRRGHCTCHPARV